MQTKGLKEERAGERLISDLTATPPQMWIDDLERFGGSDDDASSPYSPFLLHPLHAAALHGRVDVVKYYDKDSLDNHGRTPLHAAAYVGNMVVAEALLSAGADVNLRCSTKVMSALDRAAEHRHVGVARMMIEHAPGCSIC